MNEEWQDRLTMRQVARKLNVHVSTVFRWAIRGVRGRKLPTVLIGGRRFVLRSQLQKFASGVAESDRRTEPPLDTARARSIETELDRQGIRIS